MASSSHALKGPIAGALAAGGDPATSPLYVFGPFLRLVVPAGVASITFGPSIWLVVLTVSVVSLMYRLVMRWVTDGTGGTGLSEEEFGPWAAKVNAAITVIEYSLTFLVSMAALVTFLGDRLPVLEQEIFGITPRTVIALALTAGIAALVALGPRVAALTFGPATAGVLILLWMMIGATILKFGLVLPSFSWAAFGPEMIGITLGGYARILALMTGIEVFANLVPAYQGRTSEQSRKAFGSLTIIMGTTATAMLILGPAILRVADTSREDVSVFTQTMDALLPAPLAYLGTAVAMGVLVSACATALQGIAHLAHGLCHRHYLVESLGRPNRFGIAERAVWLESILLCACFLLFGTREETYLALYAAGVFILLSMTGWAAATRLFRRLRQSREGRSIAQLGAVVTAASLTSVATVIIFAERFYDGVWLYAVMIPILYYALSVMRAKLGAPSLAADEMGQRIACTCPGRIAAPCSCEHCGR